MMSFLSSIRARNVPLAGVEMAPRSTAGGPARKWTSLKPDRRVETKLLKASATGTEARVNERASTTAGVFIPPVLHRVRNGWLGVDGSLTRERLVRFPQSAFVRCRLVGPDEHDLDQPDRKQEVGRTNCQTTGEIREPVL